MRTKPLLAAIAGVLLLNIASTGAFADVMYHFRVSQVTDVSHPTQLLPISGQLTFTDASVAAGTAMLSDVVSMQLSFGSAIFSDIISLSGMNQSVSFSVDGTRILDFISGPGNVGACSAPCLSWFANPAGVDEIEFGRDRFNSTGNMFLRADGYFTDIDAFGNFGAYGNWLTAPVPPAVYLFTTGVLGLVGMARRRKSA